VASVQGGERHGLQQLQRQLGRAPRQLQLVRVFFFFFSLETVLLSSFALLLDVFLMKTLLLQS